MTNDQITAVAREFAEETRNGILGLFPQPLPDSMEVLIKNDQEYYGRFLRWLTGRYCLVEKDKLQELEIARRAKEHGAVWLNQWEAEYLFPEIAKEVEDA